MMSYAAFKVRIFAFLIDHLMISLYGICIVGSISIIFRTYIHPLFSSSPTTAQITGFCMMTLPVSLYLFFVIAVNGKER